MYYIYGSVQAIPTYRVYRLYMIHNMRSTSTIINFGLTKVQNLSAGWVSSVWFIDCVLYYTHALLWFVIYRVSNSITLTGVQIFGAKERR